ncbi:LysM peptidoglycan-binding domain-containing protein [Mycoplasmatota bacterium]|nr:LysM peptidoglycan-binding domain-containing protein [Mycoplasmatota bacterium]
MYNNQRYNQNQAEEYVVMSGDNLYQIAQKYNITPNDIITYNNLDSTTIYPGQVLLIPTQAPNGMQLFPYTTKKNDSFNSIAQTYGVTPEMIKSYNDFNSLLLAPNQNINIPLAKTYTIQQGDTLDTILKKFNLNLKSLIELNPQFLEAGQVINIR